MDNPLKMPAGTMFVLAAKQKEAEPYNKTVGELVVKLKDLGHRYFNPENCPECKDISSTLAFASMCDSIVTVPGWEADPKCHIVIQAARLLQKPVTTSDRYLFIDNHFHSGR